MLRADIAPSKHKSTPLLFVLLASIPLLLSSGCKDELSLIKQQLHQEERARPTEVTADVDIITDNPSIDNKASTGSGDALNTEATAKIDAANNMPDKAVQASTQRSPFRIANFVDPQIAKSAQNKTNLSSSEPPPLAQQPLVHSLKQFKYRGMMAQSGQQAYGLVQRPDGVIMTVAVGQSLAQEHIRILEITPTQINLVETVYNAALEATQNRVALIAP